MQTKYHRYYCTNKDEAEQPEDMIEKFKKLKKLKRDYSSDRDEEHSTEHSFTEAFTNINTIIKIDSLEEDKKQKIIEKDNIFVLEDEQLISTSPKYSFNERNDSLMSPNLRKQTYPLLRMPMYHGIISPPISNPIITRETEYTTKYDSLE
jgi:hypothetical protein